MISYTWTSAGFGIAVSALILFLVRRDILHSRFAIWWLAIAVGIAVLGVFPKLIDWIAPFFGVHYPPTLAFLIGLIVAFVKILVMDIERSHNERKLNRLIQQVAILEAKLSRKEVDGEHDN